MVSSPRSLASHMEEERLVRPPANMCAAAAAFDTRNADNRVGDRKRLSDSLEIVLESISITVMSTGS